MAAEALLAIVIAGEGILILFLMTFNAYFLTQRPILNYVKEIYFINGRRFRQAWYLVISATTFFFLIHIMALLGSVGFVLPAERARMGATIFTLSFGTLILMAFSLVFAVFIKYVRHLPANEKDIQELIAEDMRRSVMHDDEGLDIDLDLARVGDVTTERRQLGPTVSLSHYRALSTGFVAYMEHKLGHMGDAILYAVGRLSGRRVAREVLAKAPNKELALSQILAEIQENGIGLPEIHQETPDRVDVVMRESAPAAGVEPIGRTLCHYQSGMLAGIYEALSGWPTLGRETKCWGLGDRHCEFRIDLRA